MEKETRVDEALRKARQWAMAAESRAEIAPAVKTAHVDMAKAWAMVAMAELGAHILEQLQKAATFQTPSR